MKNLTIADIKLKIKAEWTFPGKLTVFGIPRGGWSIASMLDGMRLAVQVDTPEAADLFVDDIVDSGATREKWNKLFPNKGFWAPYDKTKEAGLPWLVFPWEGSKEKDGEELITRVLQFIGENPKRPGLLDTPRRVIKSYGELFAGYGQDPTPLLKTFDSDNDSMVICRDIEFYSTCEHHLIPFYGKASVGYIPKKKVIGLSKMARIVDVFARRLQLQEQLTHQIADTLMQIPGAQGAGVVIRAKHLCMCGRGVGKQDSSMVTSDMLGKFRSDMAVREEFLHLIQ